jgi:hypothetical protein
MEFASGIGVEGTYSNFRVLCQNIQVDDQSPFTRYIASLHHHRMAMQLWYMLHSTMPAAIACTPCHSRHLAHLAGTLW